MPRYKLIVEYDGTPYVGWQRQINGYAIQEAIEKAILGFTQEKVTLQVAGRTDTGVHALAQVAHVDLTKDWDEERVEVATNAFLNMNEETVAILKAQKVGEDFHARFSATSRTYEYRIHNRMAPLTLDRQRAWWVRRPLDVDAMNDAAQELLGTHDFTTFRAAQCQAKSPVKTLDSIVARREGDMVIFTVHARSFLHNQVRSLVGTLKQVGEGRWTRAYVREILEARDHQRCGELAPPRGLYLAAVGYEPLAGDNQI